MTVTNADFKDIKAGFYEAVDLLKDKHPYVHFFLNSEVVRALWASEKSKEEQIDYLQFLFCYYFNLQAQYSEVMEFCLNTQVLAEYTLSERYVMFCNLHPDFPKHMFMEMVKRGIRIKRCALCDRYFVLADKRKRDYCDRIYKGKRTCKQIGAKQRFNESVSDDIYLLQFQTIYNRMYSRYYRMDAWDSDKPTNKITEEQFKAWTDMASKARHEYKAGSISGEELVHRIKID